MVFNSFSGCFRRLYERSFLCGLLILLLLGGCAIPQVSAEDRLFIDLSVELVGTATLEKQTYDGETVGGISAIAYDVPSDRLYALSDNRDRPRFYTLKIDDLTGAVDMEAKRSRSLTVESVTYLTDSTGNPFPPGTLDPEGMALTPTGTLLISTEGSPRRQVPPTVGEYDIATGQLKTAVPIPVRYIPDNSSDSGEEQTLGVQENLSFEALAINVSSGTGGVYEPYRLFVATEGPLLQDLDFEPEVPYKNRLLHYTISPYQTTLISEHLYEMDLAPTGAVIHGLPEIAVLDQGGHFLSLERSFGFRGFTLKLFQLASGGATDISAIDSLKGDITGISPIRKQLMLDFADLDAVLDVPLQNYEAMTFGPTLRDRTTSQNPLRGNSSRSLLVMSDDNFSEDQATNLLIFRLQQS